MSTAATREVGKKSTPRVGCNVVDPQLQVKSGEDYNLEITRRSLGFLHSLGFEAVEFSHSLHWSDEEVAAVKDILGQVGIGVWSIHAWAGGDVMTAEGAKLTGDILRRAAEVARGLGAGVIVHHTSGQTLAGDGRERLQREQEVIGAAWQPGVRYALENGSRLAQMEYLLALVEAIGPDKAGVCIDTGHANLGELGAGRALRMAGKQLITTHLQDNHTERDEHLPPGDGTIDWDDIAAALREIGYQGCLMLELTDQPSPDRRAVGVREEIARGYRKARWLEARVHGER